VTFDHLRDVFLRSEPNDRFGKLSLFEEQQRGNAANGESSGNVRVLVHVQLGHRCAAVEFRRECVDGRRQAPARTAPLRPEVHQHDPLAGLIVEIVVGERLHFFGCHRHSSPQTDLPVVH
jgi:hypothetical protein